MLLPSTSLRQRLLLLDSGRNRPCDVPRAEVTEKSIYAAAFDFAQAAVIVVG